jgi:hypothetical protein
VFATWIFYLAPEKNHFDEPADTIFVTSLAGKTTVIPCDMKAM